MATAQLSFDAELLKLSNEYVSSGYFGNEKYIGPQPCEYFYDSGQLSWCLIQNPLEVWDHNVQAYVRRNIQEHLKEHQCQMEVCNPYYRFINGSVDGPAPLDFYWHERDDGWRAVTQLKNLHDYRIQAYLRSTVINHQAEHKCDLSICCPFM